LQTGGSKTELAQRNSHWSAGNPKAHGPKPHAAIQAKFNDHPAKHYIPINVSPLGTDALFVGAHPTYAFCIDVTPYLSI
jgi:hypothetical protein